MSIYTKDYATPALARIAASLTDRTTFHQALGKRGEVELRAHFQTRAAQPNKTGWTSPAGKFWERIHWKTNYLSADESGATIRISDPAIAQKIHGGTITPKKGKYLALPAIAEAYGRIPSQLHNLHLLIRWRDGVRRAVALVENYSQSLKLGRPRKDGSRKQTVGEVRGGTVWYWLVKSVTQRADPAALPPREKMEAALLDEAQGFMARLGS